MIALEVSLNGKRVCVAGADDLGVLCANVTACGKLGSRTVPYRPDEKAEIHYSIGGLTSRPDPGKDVHMRWKSVARLKVGDVIQVRIVETDMPDQARASTKAKARKATKALQRTGASRSARKTKGKSSAAGYH